MSDREAEQSEFNAVLEDDFNPPAALAILHRWRSAGDADLVRGGLEVFGLENLASVVDPPGGVNTLVSERIKAREARDFDRADRLRDEIDEAGFIVRDRPGGPILFPKP